MGSLRTLAVLVEQLIVLLAAHSLDLAMNSPTRKRLFLFVKKQLSAESFVLDQVLCCRHTEQLVSKYS